MNEYEIVITQDEDGMFIASCPSLPGCFSQGITYDDAEANIREAIQGYMESLNNHDEK